MASLSNPRIRRGIAWLLLVGNFGSSVLGQGTAAPKQESPSPTTAEDLQRKRDERHRFQTQALMTAKPGTWIFSPSEPPRIVWRDVETIRRLGVAPEPQVRWFNSQLQESATPNTGGRWLAWIEGTAPNGTPFRRSLTFFALPAILPGSYSPDLTPQFPFFPGDDPPAIIREHQQELKRIAGDALLRKLFDSEEAAMLLAGLMEAQPRGRPARFVESVTVANADIHLALKLRLLGLENRGRPLRPPVPRTSPAPVLHEGSLADAGMLPDAKTRIDDVCRAWAADTHEPFVTLVARRGVVVTHAAFGEKPAGTPIALDYRCWVASLTKTVTALLFSQFVDQELIAWDDPISKVFPDFPHNSPHVPTFRQCFNHTSGLARAGDVGDIRNPHLENVVLNGIDVNEPNVQYAYTGTGFEIAAKAMEILVGKSAYRIYDEAFFRPLGFDDVPIGNASSDGELTAWELGVLAQWVANQGSYGGSQFIRPETFAQLLPQPLQVADHGLVADEGLGLHWMRLRKPGVPADSNRPEDLLFSPKTLGHGSFSGCIFVIDPERQLVIVQTRKNSGVRSAEWRDRFFQTVAATLDDTP